MQKRILSVSYVCDGKHETPFIRLRGQWLESAGFQYKDKITLTLVGLGHMVIEKINPVNNEEEYS